MKKLLGALGIDVVIVAVFVFVGTLSHQKDQGFAGFLTVAWPFYSGLLLGWLAVQAWRNPSRLWPTGVFVYAITVVGGMTLRLLTGKGTEIGFIIVTSVVLAIGLLGWRWVARAIEARRRPHTDEELAIIAAATRSAKSRT